MDISYTMYADKPRIHVDSCTEMQKREYPNSASGGLKVSITESFTESFREEMTLKKKNPCNQFGKKISSPPF